MSEMRSQYSASSMKCVGDENGHALFDEPLIWVQNSRRVIGSTPESVRRGKALPFMEHRTGKRQTLLETERQVLGHMSRMCGSRRFRSSERLRSRFLAPDSP